MLEEEKNRERRTGTVRMVWSTHDPKGDEII
jgi:hypothetical protein